MSSDQAVGIQGNSKKYPFAIGPELLFQQFVLGSSQYTKYSELPKTYVDPKSLAQIIKK